MISKILLLFDDAQTQLGYQEEIKGSGSKTNILDLGSLLTGNSETNRKNTQQVATKFAPYPWRITRESLVKAARESLKRLDQDSEWVFWTRVLISGAHEINQISFSSFQNYASHSCTGQQPTTNHFKKVIINSFVGLRVVLSSCPKPYVIKW